MKEKINFVMPAYNEQANIEEVVAQWHPITETLNSQGVDAVLTIANDGSKDDTFKRLQELSLNYPNLEALDKSNSGHGATVMFLYKHAIDNNADYIFQTDSDGQTIPEEFWQMLDNRKNYDLQVGHRNNREDGLSRIMVTKVLKAVVAVTFGVSVTDANTPFRLFDTKKLKPILDIIPDDFFLSNVALSAIAKKKGINCRWIPITFRPRQGGVNSINLKRIFKIGIKALGDFYRINQSLKSK